MTSIAIDVRMINASGIGTVIANVVPRLIARHPEWRFRLAGDPAALAPFPWTSGSNVDLVTYRAPIYSIREQLGFPAADLRGCDVLLSPNYNIPLRCTSQILAIVNDVAHIAQPEMFSSFLKQQYARRMFDLVRRRADAIVYVSQFTAGEFLRLVGKPRGNSSVVHCGVEQSWFEIARGEAIRQRPYILFVGNVKPHKNLMRLLDSFKIAYTDIPHDLVIVGRKEGFITGDKAVLNRIAAFQGRVAFTGYVSDTELKQLYRQADALVLPSLYEGFGLPPVEAMAAGCPAMVSRAASLPEVCQDAALYCDPLDITDIAAGLRRIVHDQPLRESLIARGYRRARELNWDVSAAGYEAAIQGLLS